jgi:4-amino-4-deoxy-L-arabinose transferase-like glycosyltransferase
MLPFVGSMRLWQSGWAATIPGVACFVFAGIMLFASARMVYDSRPAAYCAVLMFALNPNLLYLQSTPMNEHVFFAMQAGVLLFSLLFARTQSMWAVAGAGVFAAAGALTRYEGWFLLPFVALYVLLAAKQNRIRTTIFFGIIAGAGPLYWLAHNAYIYSNALEFFNGPYSPKAIQGSASYPGMNDWATTLRYYGAAALLCIARPLAVLAAAGVLAASIKRTFWPVLFLALAPAFYLVSMVYSAGTPIFVPHLPPNTYYNTRYGLCVLPLAAFAAAGLVAMLPRMARPAGALAAVLIALSPWLAYPRPDSWITLKETLVNHAPRRAWTAQAAEYLRAHYRPGDGVFVSGSFGDQIGVLREAGIPLVEALHQGSGPIATATFARPDLFLREEWAIAIVGDPVSNAMLTLIKTGTPYVRVRLIEVKGAAPIEIYRRIRPMPKL